MSEELSLEGIRADLRDHVELIRRFTSAAITAPEFETSYLELTKKEGMLHEDAIFRVLDKLFGDVDEYFDDPDGTAEERAAAAELLREQAQDALRKLMALGADR